MLRQFLASTTILVTALVLLVGVAMLAGCQSTPSGDGMGNTAALSRHVGAILKRR